MFCFMRARRLGGSECIQATFEIRIACSWQSASLARLFKSRKSTLLSNENLFDAISGRLYNSKNCFIKNVDSNEKFGR